MFHVGYQIHIKKLGIKLCSALCFFKQFSHVHIADRNDTEYG